MKLTNRQKTFCKEYLVDHNSTQAAIRSGYSSKSAKNQGSRLMTNDDILAEINKSKKVLNEKLDIKKEDVIRELAKGAFANLDISKMKFSDKIKCLELLERYLNLSAPNDPESNRDHIRNRIFEAVERINKFS